MNYAVRALLNAHTASNTLSRIDSCNALIVYADGIARANLYAVAVAKAGEGAEIITLVVHISRLTCFGAVVIILLFLGTTESVAGNVCNLLDNVVCCDAHYCGYFSCRSVAAGDTKIRFIGLSLRECLSIRIAAGKAAGAAVCTGKNVSYSIGALILLHAEENRCNRQKKRAKNTGRKKNCNGN